jgi:TatA/E family protein of Tat protein translocase
MFDSKMLLVVLAIALVIFGTKRVRTIGSDLGAAMKGFKQAVSDNEPEEGVTRAKQDAGPALDPAAGARGAPGVRASSGFDDRHSESVQ